MTVTAYAHYISYISIFCTFDDDDVCGLKDPGGD